MPLPYPADPASPSAPNPYFPDNGFVRGDQFRANNAKIWANTDYLDSRITSEVAAIIARLPRGLLIGGVSKDSNNPPTVKAGTYDVKGTAVQVTADTALTWLANSLGDTAIASNYWYYVGIKPGAIKVHLAWGNSARGSTAIQKITSVGGGVWELGVLNAVDLSSFAVGMVVPVTGTTSSANSGVFESTAFSNVANSGGAGLKYIRIRNSNGAAQAGVAGTLTAYYRVGSVTTAADTRIYSPAPTWSETYGGYLSDYDSSYRLIAMFSTDGSGDVVDVIPFGQGSKKNDSLIAMDSVNTYVNNAIRFTNVYYNRGTDVTLSDDGTDATMLTANVAGWLDISCPFFAAGSTQQVYFVKNGTTSAGQTDAGLVGQGFSTAGNYGGANAPGIWMNPGDVVRIYAASLTLSVIPGTTRFVATFKAA